MTGVSTSATTAAPQMLMGRIGELQMLDKQAALAGLQMMPRDPVEVALRHVHYTLDAQRRVIYDMEFQMDRMNRMLGELIRKPCCCGCKKAEGTVAEAA